MLFKKVLVSLAVLAIASAAGLFALLSDKSLDLDEMAVSAPVTQQPDLATVRTTKHGEIIGFADSNNTYGWL
ncbi:MAG: hypothetical protein P8N61_09250, partial [Porticoccaceae bacterium]|nr:hypothetical protein [Porticoccaceae bacterium]